jgi:hypothetical protein
MQNTIVQPVSIQLLNASATALTTATPKNIPLPAPTTQNGNWPQPVANALFLPPGWWLMEWTVNFTGTATTTTLFQAGVSTTTATLPTLDAGLIELYMVSATVASVMSLQGSTYVNVGANGLNYFLVAQETFSAGTVVASGYINALQTSQ